MNIDLTRNPLVKAKINWLLPDKKGRRNWESGRTFCMPVIIEDQKQMFINKECDNMWSLVVEIVEQATENSDVVARITFLVEDAPHYLLYEGNKFELWDGKTVGVGEVIN